MDMTDFVIEAFRKAKDDSPVMITKGASRPFLARDETSGRQVFYRYLFNQGGKPELAIVIRPNTTKDDIVSTWNEICKIRDQIRQAPGSEDVYRILLNRYYGMRKQGNGKVKIANAINNDLILYLCVAAEEIESGVEPYNSLGVHQVHHILLTTLIEHEAKQYLPNALRAVLKGRITLADLPIDPDLVKTRLYRRARSHFGKTNLTGIPELTSLEIEMKVAGLLEKAHQRMEKILEGTNFV